MSDDFWDEFKPRRINRKDNPPTLICNKCNKPFTPRYISDKKGGYWFVRQKRCKECWNSGFTDKFGYSHIKIDGKYVPVHRYNMENKIGRKLTKYETVHHKDGNRSNNSIDNLELWATRHGKGVRALDISQDDINNHILGVLSLC